MELKLIKEGSEGQLSDVYRPLQNVWNESDNKLGDFDTDELKISLHNPVSIETQQAYDGTVNLILNDDYNPPRIVNSRFTTTENHGYRVINRNQEKQSNIYDVGKIDQQTRLFRTLNSIAKVDLIDILNTGQMMGGNYTFYIKLADNDYNKSDIVAESGIVEVFKGNVGDAHSISGALLKEHTDKAVTLRISGIDTAFTKIYVYYVRSYSDASGGRLTEAVALSEPFSITGETTEITITGYETTEDTTIDALNVQYNTATAVKTHAQVQNMLFFGNVEDIVADNVTLQNISYYVQVELKRGDSVGYIDPKDYSSDEGTYGHEYYNPLNTYYRLGYWPDELYRLGIVYIMNDDSLSPVYNLRGCDFTKIEINHQFSGEDIENKKLKTIPKTDFLDEITLENTMGVFRNKYSYNDVIQENSVTPLYYQVTIPEEVRTYLKDAKVKGYFIVRQNRIPTTIAEGYSLGVNKHCGIPMPKVGDDYLGESFLSLSSTNSMYHRGGGFVASGVEDTSMQKFASITRAVWLNLIAPGIGTAFTKKVMGTTSNYKNTLSDEMLLNDNYKGHLLKTSEEDRKGTALLCLDADVMDTVGARFNGSEFTLKRVQNSKLNTTDNERLYYQSKVSNSKEELKAKVIKVAGSVPLIYQNGYQFSSKCGVSSDVSQFSYFHARPTTPEMDMSKKDSFGSVYTWNSSLIRGEFTGFLGVLDDISVNSIYDIKVPNYSESNMKQYFLTRGNDKSEFHAVSDRLSVNNSSVNVYRGDCFTNTVTIRLNRNFVDPEVPLLDTIVDSKTWNDNYLGYAGKPTDDEKSKYYNRGGFEKMNRADINAVPLGMWVTYKCLSNYNLGLRSEDESHPDERAQMGSTRKFYPLADVSTAAGAKVPESLVLNSGYNRTLSYRYNYLAQDVPYIKDMFDTRVMFSNVQRNDAFQNAYRIFQGLSYQDYDRHYGGIVKLLPWGTNLLCVFEHGVAILPINEKALIQTTTGQSVHMYGAGVLPEQISVLSEDFGSIWQDSVIRTPLAAYGVDTVAKKIWRVRDRSGILECISDMHLQQFLNNHINLTEFDQIPTIAVKNVKSHYNNYKGDVIFTFYNEDETWSICYNERMDKWVTKYTWIPLLSDNIDNQFYSLDRERASLLVTAYNMTDPESYSVRLKEDTDAILFKTDFGFLLDADIVKGNGSSSPETPVAKILDSGEDFLKFEFTYIPNYEKGKIGQERIHKVFTEPCNEFSWESKFEDGKFSLFIEADPKYSDIPYIKVSGKYVSQVGGTHKFTLLFQNEGSTQFNEFFQNSIYLHGRAGNSSEINYTDEREDNNIKPTYWYDRQEPFELEFVVNEGVGLHKIFDNLIIISNKAMPKSFEYEIIGDVYFDKVKKDAKSIYWKIKDGDLPEGYPFTNAQIVRDDILNQFSIRSTQDCKDMVEVGRVRGNIHYKEDAWYTTIEPIRYESDAEYKYGDETRIRDKFVKIRIKYTGEDPVLITAIQTLYTQSYA